MAVKKKPSKKAPRSSRARLDPNTWLERAQAMLVYSNSLKDADDKVLKLFDTVSEQTKKYFEFDSRLYTLSFYLLSAILIISFGLALFAPSGNTFYQIFSLVGLVSSIIALIYLLARNPLKYARRMLENIVRVNVVFLSFVRRLQQSDLALRLVFTQNQSDDFKKVYAQIQEFQNLVDQTSEEINQVLQDLDE